MKWKFFYVKPEMKAQNLFQNPNISGLFLFFKMIFGIKLNRATFLV